MPVFAYILIALAAYLLGSLPAGYLVGRAKGIDIRTVGSKNMGATNVLRVLGMGPGILVLFVDGLKGFVAAGWLCDALLRLFTVPAAQVFWVHIMGGIFAVLGHNYTCWLKFKGGKGIATTAGAYFALAPVAVSIALAIWIIVFLTTRYVSVASIAAAIALPTAVWFTEASALLGVVTTALGALAIYKHKGNIKRLLAGTESRINFKKEKTVA